MSDKINDRKIAKTNMDKQAKKIKILFEKKRKIAVSYSFGDLVLCSGSETSRKEVTKKTPIKFGGPYKITEVKGNDRYEISSLKGMKGYKKYKATIPADQLRKFKSRVIIEDESDNSGNSTDELLDLLEN